MTLVAQIYSGKCKIPLEFRLYHAGKPLDDLIKKNPNVRWNILGHVYFSANMGYVQMEYLEDLSMKQSKGKNLYIIDARDISKDSFVITNFIGVWYDELNRIQEILDGFEHHKINTLSNLIKCDLDFSYSRLLKKCPELKTYTDFSRRLEEAKYYWFLKYTKPFNIMHMNRYKNQDRNIMGIPGPIPVKSY